MSATVSLADQVQALEAQAAAQAEAHAALLTRVGAIERRLSASLVGASRPVIARALPLPSPRLAPSVLKRVGEVQMAPLARRLLDSLTSEGSVLAHDIAELEQREADIRLELDTARALQWELLRTADVLNRQRL